MPGDLVVEHAHEQEAGACVGRAGMRFRDRDRVDVGIRVVEADDDDLVMRELPLKRLRQIRVDGVAAEAGVLGLRVWCVAASRASSSRASRLRAQCVACFAGVCFAACAVVVVDGRLRRRVARASHRRRRVFVRAAEHEHARAEPDGCEEADEREDLDLRAEVRFIAALPAARLS